MIKTTETDSKYNDIEKMSVNEILQHINKEDQSVAHSVYQCIPQIEKVVTHIVKQLSKENGRLFYMGAGTSGRLGVVDASECPPTFGVSAHKVIGLIAGGERAIRKAVENAEDDRTLGWKELSDYNISQDDFVIGIAASGTTPYVLGAMEKCKEQHIPCCGISCNAESPLSQIADYAITPIVGPEFITGSSRMKAGTAQKMVLNMISTSTMIQLGHIKGNKMVDMQLSNTKLVDRGVRMILEQIDIPREQAKKELLEKGSVRAVLDQYGKA